MYTITKEIEFDAGHRVPLHESKCKNPHGHRYKVVAEIVGEELISDGPESGMVRDFSVVKELLTKYVHDVYDHGFIAHESDDVLITLFHLNKWKTIVTPWYPTAECLARSIYDDLKEHLPMLIGIQVWETPTSCAIYSPTEGVPYGDAGL